ncbi:hypothetical protein G9A89_014186 [Geosiphon pyriformis]|nr:hypothetical protein G9A89_014186 [Geosiphon pyriformis]
MVQVLNQFIKGLQSGILRSIRPCHPTSLQDAVALARNFESAEQEANHTQAINLAINGTSDINTKITQLKLQELTNHTNREKITTTADTHSNRTVSNSNNLGDPILATKIMDQNKGNPYQQPKYQQNMISQYSLPQNQLSLYAQQVPYTQTPLQNYYQPLPMTQAIPHYQTSPYSPSRSRWTVSTNPSWFCLILTNTNWIPESSFLSCNIPPATITEDTTLATIFLFDINNLNTHSLFSEAAINQDKPITVLYTNARVGGIDIKLILDSRLAVDHVTTAWIITADGNTKTPIREIDNFLFEINGIQISTKVLVIEATQYQALPMLLSTRTPKNFNSCLTDSMPKSQLCADTSKPNMNNYQTELLLLPTWEEKRKGRAKKELQLSSLGYVTSDQRNLFYQPLRLICVNCGKKLFTMGTCIGDNEEWPTATKYYCRPYKWDNTPCLACSEILPDEELWNDVSGRGGTCNEACQYTILINDWVQKGTPIKDAWK